MDHEVNLCSCMSMKHVSIFLREEHVGRQKWADQLYKLMVYGRINLNLVMATMTTNVGVVYYELLAPRTINGEKFRHFLTNLGLVLDSHAAVILIDNAPPRRGVQMDRDFHTIRYLPAYSLFLSAIENAFSVFRNATHKKHTKRAGAPESVDAG